MKKAAALITILALLLTNSGCAVKAPNRNSLGNETVSTLVSSGAPTKISSIPSKGNKPAGSEVPFSELAKKYDLVSIPTYDGSGQITHPKVLYFPSGWNGYKYWMSFTPYPDGVANYENPSMVVSNDLIHWKVPGSLKNPVSGIPTDVNYGGHYSDSHIVVHGKLMELWYRYDKGNKKTHHTDYSVDYYYRRTSSDGVHWSQPQLMQSSKGGILSLAVNYTGGEYEFWYTDYKHRLLHAESTNGTAWNHISACSLTLPKNYAPWHQDVVQYNGEYYLLQTGINLSKYSFSLFLSHSPDGVHFTPGIPFYPSDNPMITKQAWLYRSTLLSQGDKFAMLIAVRFPDGRWYLMKSELPVSQFLQQGQKPVILNQQTKSQKL